MTLDAVVIGSGPNGLAAAITLARAGRAVVVLEAGETPGGGMRSAELTLPGYLHDVCSAIHPLGVASPFFRKLPLADFGLEWIHPDLPVAHPLPDGTTAILERSLETTAAGFGVDGPAYQRLLSPFVDASAPLLKHLLGPLRLPQQPLLLARFGRQAVRSARGLASAWFEEDQARSLFAGMAAHSLLPLEDKLTAAVGLLFCVTAHADGWPLPKSGSQAIARALEAYLRSLGGEIILGRRVTSLAEVPASRAVLFDTAPRDLARIAGDTLPVRYRRGLEKFRHGPGVFKVDWALDGPIPWTAEPCRRAGTVHVGGTFEEVAAAERAAWSDAPHERPFVLVAQQSLFDSTRAPAGKHTGWGYCHVPHGSKMDMTERIEAQIERFAPGFHDLILKRHTMAPADFQTHNPNYVGGDITGGVMDLRQIVARPALRWTPYSTPNPKLFLCSASTPPGAGVHGMCGYHAAHAALATVLR